MVNLMNIQQKLNELKSEVASLKNMLANHQEIGPINIDTYINIVIWGRILINHVQDLKYYDEQLFEKWFHKYRLEIFGKPEEEAKKLGLPDKKLNYLIQARNKLEHEEMPKFNSTMQIKQLNLPKDLGPPPPNATGVFIDGFGAGWLIKMPDSTSEKLYVSLPVDKAKITIKPIDLTDLDINSIIDLLNYYVDYLTRMVEDARKTFTK